MHPHDFDDPPCRDTPALFFGRETESPGESQARNNRAKRICHGCPHLDPCRNWAVDNDEDGVWGGTTPLDRQRIRGGRPARPVTGVHGPQAARLLEALGIAA